MENQTIVYFTNGEESIFNNGYFVVENSPIRYDPSISIKKVNEYNILALGPMHCQKCLDFGCIRGVFTSLCDECADYYFDNNRCSCYDIKKIRSNTTLFQDMSGAADRINFGFKSCGHKNCPLLVYQDVEYNLIGCKENVVYTLHKPEVVSTHIRFQG